MTGRRFLSAIALLFLTAASLLAEPSIVNIQLKSGEVEGVPRTVIEVGPNASAVCRGQEHSPGCLEHLNFRWVGPGVEDDTARIWVEYKNGLYWDDEGKPAQLDATECFEFPGGANPFSLERGAANGRNLIFRHDNEGCKDKVAFFYDISCQQDSEPYDCGVEPLDPGTMVDNGRRR